MKPGYIVSVEFFKEMEDLLKWAGDTGEPETKAKWLRMKELVHAVNRPTNPDILKDTPITVALSEWISVHEKLAAAKVQQERSAEAMIGLHMIMCDVSEDNAVYSAQLFSEGFLYPVVGKCKARSILGDIRTRCTDMGLDYYHDVEKPANARLHALKHHSITVEIEDGDEEKGEAFCRAMSDYTKALPEAEIENFRRRIRKKTVDHRLYKRRPRDVPDDYVFGENELRHEYMEKPDADADPELIKRYEAFDTDERTRRITARDYSHGIWYYIPTDHYDGFKKIIDEADGASIRSEAEEYCLPD